MTLPLWMVKPMRTASAVRPPSTWTELTSCRHQEFRRSAKPELAYCGTACRARPAGFTTLPRPPVSGASPASRRPSWHPSIAPGRPGSGQSEHCARTEIARNVAQLPVADRPVGVTRGPCAMGEVHSVTATAKVSGIVWPTGNSAVVMRAGSGTPYTTASGKTDSPTYGTPTTGLPPTRPGAATGSPRHPP